MAVLPPPRPRLLALAWLAVALWLAATGGCLCRHVLPTTPYSLQPPPADAPHVPGVPAPRRPSHPVHPLPICRGPFCRPPHLPPICPQEGCSGQGSP